VTTSQGSNVITREPDPTDDLERGDPTHARAIWTLTAVLVVALWIRPLVSSLWLDEAGTWWVIKDGLGDAIARATRYHGQSPLYYVIEWLTRRTLGPSEVALRVPSILAYAGAAVVVFRLARRLAGPEVARLAVLVFAGSAAAFSAADARPYALALLCITGAAASLAIWLDRASPRWGAAYVVLAALAIWSHFLFAIAVVAMVPYAIVRVRHRSTDVGWPWVAGAWLAIVALALPLAGQLLSLRARASSLTSPANPSFLELVYALVAPIVCVALVAGIGLALIYVRPTLRLPSVAPGTAAFLVPWALLPPALLLGLAIFTSVKFVAPRYSYAAAPAAAILGGYALASIGPALATRIVAACFAIIAVVALGSPLHGNEDWRGAAAAIGEVSTPSTVVLAQTGLIEATQIDWLRDPERASYLLAPFSYYRVPGDLVPLPLHLEQADERRYVDDLVDGRLRQLDRFLLVFRAPSAQVADRIDGALHDDGWTWRSLGTFGSVGVYEFVRGGDTS
jgi:mannosyltransferase